MSRDEWCTVVGVFADSCGIVQWQHNTVHRAISPGGREHIRIDRSTTSAIEPASAYRPYQPDEIPIRWQHRERIGKTVLLDRRQNRLLAVGVFPLPVDAFEGDGVELFFSSGTKGPAPFSITELSLTPSPASRGLPPVQFFDGLPGEAMLYGDGRPREMLRHADEVIRAAHGVERARCRFDDLDAPSRVESRADEPMEMFYSAPIGRVLKVNGRPPRGLQ